MAFKNEFFKFVIYQVGGRVLVAVDFFQDDIFLFFNLLLRKDGMEKHVAEEFKTAGEVLRKRGGVDTGLLLGGKGVELPSHPVDTVEDVEGSAMLGTLEYGMLYEMGHPFLFAHLIAGTHIDIDS